MQIYWILFFLVCALTAVYGFNYSEVLYKSLLFYQAQRSGRLCNMDPLVSWRKSSGLADKGDRGEDLVGGYYDEVVECLVSESYFILPKSVGMPVMHLGRAKTEYHLSTCYDSVVGGDHMKFGFPMAFTTTMLSWGVISYPKGYRVAGQLHEVKRAIRWATDYFLNCHVRDNVLYGQVGNPMTDHSYWGRPEDMTMPRPAYYIDKRHPGTDLAGETAAALAAASLVFVSTDLKYAKKLRMHAQQLFSFAERYRGIYSDSIPTAASCYRSSGFEDELVWAAAWLFKATRRPVYRRLAVELYESFQLELTSGFNWDEKRSGIDVLLTEATDECLYKAKLKSFCDLILAKERTPKGLVFLGEWGSLRNIAHVAFILMKAADLGLSGARDYRLLAQNQINYALGSSGRSYMVGFGRDPPTHYHHRSSSCPDAPEPCDWCTFNDSHPNSHVLYGALVGGPDCNDCFVDVRNDVIHNSVACDYNAGFQGVVAGLLHLGYLEESSSPPPCISGSEL